MGLDMFVYGVSKVNENDVPENISKEWLQENEYSYTYLVDLGEDGLYSHKIVDLVPYSVIRVIETKAIDYQKILSDNGFPADTPIGIGMISPDEIAFSVKKNNEFENIFISTEDVNNNYKITTVEKVLIHKLKMLAYWRKEYDLQNFFYENLDECDNVTFREINEDLFFDLVDYLRNLGMGTQFLENWKDYDTVMYYECY